LERDCFGIYTEKDLAQNCLSQSEEEGKGEGACPSRGTAYGGQIPQVEAFCHYVREKRSRVGARKWSHGMVEIQLLRFRRLSPVFNPYPANVENRVSS
jgi:hypothetical protein